MKIYAHRGFSHKFPESTRSAYLGAVKAGSDGLECDVRLTKDGQIICFHDPTTKRINGRRNSISKRSLFELQKITEVLTLKELLEIAIENHQDLLIETKHPVRTGGKIEREVIALLNAHKEEIAAASIRVIVMSFSYLAVRRLKANYKDVAKVIKYAIAAMLTSEKILALNIKSLSRYPHLLRRVKDKHILVWTINSRAEFEFISEQKIDGVITDRVRRARNMLKE